MSSTSIPHRIDHRSHDLTSISMLDSLIATALLCLAIWSLIVLTILAT